MGTVLTPTKDEKEKDLQQWIQLYNRTTDKYILIEIVHLVYNLGYDEIAEEMTSSIYGQTENLKLLLGQDYQVTENNNYKKPSTSLFRQILNSLNIL